LTKGIESTIEEVETRIKQAESKVEMIFLEACRGSVGQEPIPEHIG
jgi:hypothetical protein